MSYEMKKGKAFLLCGVNVDGKKKSDEKAKKKQNQRLMENGVFVARIGV
jgi:hypothetical protein